MFEEGIVPLSPISYFQIGYNCYFLPPGSTLNNKYLLPVTSAICAEKQFADVSLGWNQEGIFAQVLVRQPVHQMKHPDLPHSDSVELFFDTRDVKTSGYNTRFCHHFFFLPEPVEGLVAGELTHFRTDDAHELCDPADLKVEPIIKSNSYTLNIFIPSHCLNGYDPEQFDRLGFTYRINRAGGHPQHFSVTSEDYQLEQQPSLWSTLKLISTKV